MKVGIADSVADDAMDEACGDDTGYGTMSSDEDDCVDVDMLLDDSHGVVADVTVGNGIGTPEP
jgi:hypothetical protein